jgi:hypothetical protein
MEKTRVVGLKPWLPWPLNRWRLFTAPLPGERLAALRIALCAVLLLDIFTTFGPHLRDFYGPDSLSRVADLDLFEYVVQGGHKPNWYWSLLRGLGHPLNFGLAVLCWLGLSVAAAGGLSRGRRSPGDGIAWPSPAWLMTAWSLATMAAVLGAWARLDPETSHIEPLSAALMQMGAVALPWLFVSGLWLFARRARSRIDPGARSNGVRAVAVAWLLTTLLVLASVWQVLDSAFELGLPLDLSWLLEAWDQDLAALRLGLVLWAVAVLLLLIGLWTRPSAIVAWMLTLSFDGLNHYVIDSGETARSILLFYLMLTPCGAVWSLDAWRRRSSDTAAVYVHPWAFRLMFLQLILMYFLNGVYKLFGVDWREGSSLYYVLAAPHLSRFPYSQLPIPFPLLQFTTYLVLAWELTFPLLVVFRWTRIPALVLGALFHLGILVSMEIGYFALYMLCFYVPLLPWERLARRRGRDSERVISAAEACRDPC